MYISMKRNKKYTLCLQLTSMLTLSHWVGQGAAVHAEASEELQEIVVTATKRLTPLQDTAMSITVLGSDTLTKTGADDFADFAKLVPGLSATDLGPGNKRYALRGLQSPGEPEVALYYDEIPVSGLPGASLDTGASQLDLKLVDVDRIEVLRGPEGTLYGNGSEGGAIRIISNRPVMDKFAGFSEVSGSVTDGGAPSYTITQMVNIPLIDDLLAVRIAGYYRHEGGWINDAYQSNIALPQIDANNLNGEQTGGVRVSFSLNLNERWNLADITYYQHLHTDNSFETYPSFASAADPYVSKAFVRTPWNDVSVMNNLISTYELPFATLIATGSYQHRTVELATDTTRYLLSLFGCTIYNWDRGCTGPQILPAASFAQETVNAWSGEARLVSSTKGPFQWTVGGAFQNTHDYRNSQVATADSAGYVEFDASDNAVNRLFARNNYDDFNQYSVFGNVSYEILHDLTGTVGLRWFHSYRSDEQVILQQFFPNSPTGAEPFQAFSEGALFKSFALSYKISPATLVYVQASQGFRAGGPNYPGGFTATAPPYRSDSVWDYEAGLKATFKDGRIKWNSAVFWINWSDLQVILPQANFSYISNSGSARSQGFETEFTDEILHDLTAALSLSFNNAQLVGPQPIDSNPVDQLRAGDRLAGVPEWTANASLSYRQHPSRNYSVTEWVDVSYQSSRSTVVPPQNPAYFVTRPYELVDLHFQVDRADGWGLIAGVENLFNRYAELSAQPSDANLITTITAARPRTLLLGINKRY
jgi:iron complex outermembrane recepter protein